MGQVTIQQAMEMAVGHHNAGRLAEAEGLYRQILANQPGHADALHLLGVVKFQCNQLDTARELIGRAIAIHPIEGIYHYNLGHVLTMAGKRKEAIESYRRAISLQPGNGAAYNNLGVVLAEDRQYSAAIEAYQTAIRLNPPNLADVYCNLSNALREDHQVEAALKAAERANELEPKLAAGLNNLGAALLRSGQFEEAIASYRRAIELEPEFAMAHYNLAMSLLLTGRFEEGWPHQEWRWKARELGLTKMNFPQPMWSGSTSLTTGGDLLDGKRIFLHAEQGFGDAIQFVRYVPEVIARGGRVILAVQKELIELMRTIPGIEQIVTDGDTFPPFDVHCAMLSLPVVLKTRLDTIPANIPYLHADPARVEAWRVKLDRPKDSRMKVGLVWAGSATHKNDRNRSIGLSQLAPLAGVRGVRFISLQKGEGSRQPPPDGMEIEHYGDDLRDFSDSAGLIANLDLLITVDTAPAHLAGAMGKPVWTFIPHIPDWRWMLERTDSPWYPTMKLYRQPATGDWRTPIAKAAADLQRMLGAS